MKNLEKCCACAWSDRYTRNKAPTKRPFQLSTGILAWYMSVKGMRVKGEGSKGVESYVLLSPTPSLLPPPSLLLPPPAFLFPPHPTPSYMFVRPPMTPPAILRLASSTHLPPPDFLLPPRASLFPPTYSNLTPPSCIFPPPACIGRTFFDPRDSCLLSFSKCISAILPPPASHLLRPSSM
jgi:hypothetical protein